MVHSAKNRVPAKWVAGRKRGDSRQKSRESKCPGRAETGLQDAGC